MEAATLEDAWDWWCPVCCRWYFDTDCGEDNTAGSPYGVACPQGHSVAVQPPESPMVVASINSFTGDYEFLSNFYPSHICVRGSFYPTVEHAYQAHKTLVYTDRNWITSSATPGLAKRRGSPKGVGGRKITLRENWNSMRDEVMLECLRAKFDIPELRGRLMATGTALLVEGNSWGDRYWGVASGYGGQNMLGKLLMKVRSEGPCPTK